MSKASLSTMQGHLMNMNWHQGELIFRYAALSYCLSPYHILPLGNRLKVDVMAWRIFFLGPWKRKTNSRSRKSAASEEGRVIGLYLSKRRLTQICIGQNQIRSKYVIKSHGQKQISKYWAVHGQKQTRQEKKKIRSKQIYITIGMPNSFKSLSPNCLNAFMSICSNHNKKGKTKKEGIMTISPNSYSKTRQADGRSATYGYMKLRSCVLIRSQFSTVDFRRETK